MAGEFPTSKYSCKCFLKERAATNPSSGPIQIPPTQRAISLGTALAGPAALGHSVDWCSESDTPNHEFSVEAQVTLYAGKSSQVQINRLGPTIIGKVRAIDETGAPLNFSCGIVKLKQASSLPNLLRDLLGSWGEATSSSHPFPLPGTTLPPLSFAEKFDADGAFRLPEIPPGSYYLHCTFLEKSAKVSEPQDVHGTSEKPFTVPDNPMDSIDLGIVNIVVHKTD